MIGVTVSRVLSLDSYLSRPFVAKGFKRSVKPWDFYQTLLATDWVYLADHVATTTGGLLPHPFTFDRRNGSLLSVALALRSLWPPVRWSPVSL